MNKSKSRHRQSPDAARAEMELAAAKKLQASIPRKNVLRYSVVRQVIWGLLGGKAYGPFKAPSGSGQDGIDVSEVNYVSWNPARQVNKKQLIRGGVIMPGWWIIVPEELARKQQSSQTAWGAAPTASSLRVLPYQLDGSYVGSNRNSFYIHGTGGHGSDGCILLPPNHRQVLVDLVCSNGGAWLHAYLSGIELNEALASSDHLKMTA